MTNAVNNFDIDLFAAAIMDCWDKLDSLVQRGKSNACGGHGRLVATNAVP